MGTCQASQAVVELIGANWDCVEEVQVCTQRPKPVGEDATCNNSPRKGTSLTGSVGPLFFLELEGNAVRKGLPGELRRIVHGPNLSDAPRDLPMGLFPPLVLGRVHAIAFWEQVLCPHAYLALSRAHLVLEPCSSACRCESASVGVTNLSSIGKVRVCSSSEDVSIESAPVLEPNEQQVLNHGDIVVMIPNQDIKLWFTFKDLRQVTLC